MLPPEERRDKRARKRAQVPPEQLTWTHSTSELGLTEIDAEGVTVAFVSVGSNKRMWTDEEKEALGRLIAAVPDLLAACKLAEELLETVKEPINGYCALEWETAVAVRAALTRARGEEVTPDA
jgi:hypothetical protein